MGWPFFVGDTVKRAQQYRDELKQADKNGFRRGVIVTLVVEALIALGIGWLINKANASTVDDDALNLNKGESGFADIAERTNVKAPKPQKSVEAIKKAYDDVVSGKEISANDIMPENVGGYAEAFSEYNNG